MYLSMTALNLSMDGAVRQRSNAKDGVYYGTNSKRFGDAGQRNAPAFSAFITSL
ncbi:protein of unknown function [Methylotuvimicrobium alcaliphilum 20Z]|uniref:Uncharacterized protein n=1 Tax=Methylotuvimicrobium alcaliphilum (strain DSM 19304 / NCIMB 14124 / VKM B-2133 / 20Z) TaxID=1091494 RepID=G4T1Y4_META2|nr:protein of unknown function [Methylotuvimicrobium alcaliphilum 20Z]